MESAPEAHAVECRCAVSRVVFVGELATDLIITDAASSVTGSPSFAWGPASDEEWISTLGQATAEALPLTCAGGSIANAAAAFAGLSPRSAPVFVAVEIEAVGTVSPRVWQPSYNVGEVDLKLRGVAVIGSPANQSQPYLPSALVTTDGRGVVTSIVAREGRALSPELPSGDILVVRLDHLPRIPDDKLRGFGDIVVLLTDDRRGSDAIERCLRLGSAVTVFGSGDQIPAMRQAHVWVEDSRCTTVQTNGSKSVTVSIGRDELTFDVVKAEEVRGDLGAGDAYLGGWVFGMSTGLSVAECHERAGEAARSALTSVSARPSPSLDFGRMLPLSVDRVSTSEEEGGALEWIAAAPGVSILSGGQSGVETWVVEEAARAGVPTTAVFPAGMRRINDGDIPLENASVFELGAKSYRYRTWFEVFAADVVLLLDWNSGEGSAETRRAASHFHRPILELSPTSTPAMIEAWLRHHGAQTVLIAGNRASYFDREGQIAARAAVRAAVSGVVQAVANTLAHAVQHIAGACDAVASSAENWARGEGLLVSDAAVVSARDAADGLVGGKYQRVITWPALLPAAEALDEFVVRPLGAFASAYGFVSSGPLRTDGLIGVQYSEAFSRLVRSSPSFGLLRTSPIAGRAEQRITDHEIDAAYDTMSTGRTMRAHGLDRFSMTHWETLSVIERRGQ